MINPGLIVAAHIAGKQIAENMKQESDYSPPPSGLSSKDRNLLAESIALNQCTDLTNVPTVSEYIFTNTNANQRSNKNCYKCKHSKVFNYIDRDCEENPEDSKRMLICLKMLVEFPVEMCKVDDEHYCRLFEQSECKGCGCCNHDN